MISNPAKSHLAMATSKLATTDLDNTVSHVKIATTDTTESDTLVSDTTNTNMPV